MAELTKSPTREIIKDFAKEIREKKRQTAKPSKTVINFRDDFAEGTERDVWKVPIGLLRYRKDNGRITSDVLDYERTVGFLDEKDLQGQSQIATFLERKDPERTNTLKKSIMQDGQQEPAIITCDGFLINGNRRKLVLEKLHEENPSKEYYNYMKVVILPNEGEEGGPPTLLEIEKIENRYQLQKEGRSEYYGFDRALSIKRKIEHGFSLRDQLLDDPNYANATEKQIKKAEKEYQKEYLDPLECVDRYLKQFGREGVYSTISGGSSDPEGRWQAFKDYATAYNNYFKNPNRRHQYGIEEDEIGDIEEAAFDIIRLRTIPAETMPKVHSIMRELPKYCRTEDGKKAIKKIPDEVAPTLPPEDLKGEDGNWLSSEEIDAKWAAKFQQPITHLLKKARDMHKDQKEKETPVELLDSAYKKITHDDMDIGSLHIGDLAKARTLAVNIKNAADEIESEIYRCEKDIKKLENKKL